MEKGSRIVQRSVVLTKITFLVFLGVKKERLK